MAFFYRLLQKNGQKRLRNRESFLDIFQKDQKHMHFFALRRQGSESQETPPQTGEACQEGFFSYSISTIFYITGMLFVSDGVL